MKRIVFNQKGGCGKSTIAVNLAAIAASQGKRTLLIDLDPQCNASRYLLGDAAKTVTPTIANFFEEMLSYSFRQPSPMTYVHETQFDNLHVIPAHVGLSELQSKLESRMKIYKLRDAMNELAKEYDELIVDAPPAWCLYSQVALIAADSCLIPFDCDDFSRDALYSVMANINEIRTDHNPNLVIEGIVVNQYHPRANLPQRLVNELIAEGLPVLNSKLSSSVAIRESHSQHIPMIFLDPAHKLSSEFTALYTELAQGEAAQELLAA